MLHLMVTHHKNKTYKLNARNIAWIKRHHIKSYVKLNLKGASDAERYWQW